MYVGENRHYADQAAAVWSDSSTGNVWIAGYDGVTVSRPDSGEVVFRSAIRSYVARFCAIDETVCLVHYGGDASDVHAVREVIEDRD